ncbi:MAG: PilW family protein [Nitrospirae bacterium]|nr:PilW family protein [Nitrospirota bacterium]
MELYKNAQGYTIGELMVAIVVGTLLIAASAATYIAQNRSYTTQESVSEINTQSKIAHDMISNDIKTAGFGVPDDLAADPIAGYSTVMNPLDSSTGPDAVTIIGSYRRIGSFWPAGTGPTSGLPCPAGSPTKIQMNTTQVSITLSGTVGANDSDRRFLSFDGVDYAEVKTCTVSGDENNCSGTITLDRPLTASYPLRDTNGDSFCDEGRPVYLVEDVTYCVGGTSGSTLLRIRGNANVAACSGTATSQIDPIAENIEDLQLAYARDTLNSDGMVDTAFQDAPAVPSATFNSAIQAVRVSVLARADKPDSDYAGQGNPPATIENRNHGETNDDFRRRWWQKTVTVRNRWGR